MADYIGSNIFSQARQVNAEEPGVVSQFVNARVAESDARQAEVASTTPPPTTKIPSLVAAVMRGNAQIQSDSRSKEFKQKLDQTLARVKITEHGDGTVDIKGAPAEFFNGQSMAADGKASVEEPMKKVDQALGTGAAAPAAPAAAPAVHPAAAARPEEVAALETMYQANDAAWGQRLPRPYEVDEMLKTPEGVRKLTALLGGTEEHARINIKRAQHANSRQILRDNLTRNLVKMHSQLYGTSKPAITDNEQASRANLEGTKETRRVVNSFLDNRVEGYASADDAVATIKQHVVDSGLPWTDAIERETRNEYAAKRGAADTAKNKTVFEHIRGMKDEDIRGYGGDSARWIADTEGSLGVTFSPEQRGRAEAKFKGIAQEVQDAERKVEVAQSREAVAQSLAARREARQVAVADRAVEVEARKARNEERSVTTAALKERDTRTNAVLKKLDDLDSEIRKNSLQFAKEGATDDERAELRRQNKMLVEQIPVEQDKLYMALGFKLVTQERYDELIALGLTPKQIADDKVRVSKQSAKKR